jgi:hypothetical protein
MIKVIGFHTSYERLPVLGDPIKEDLDERGYRLGEKGKRIMEMQEVDWVTYAPAHSPVNSQVVERVKHLMPTEEMLHGEQTEKIVAMRVRWSQIEPAYAAFKTGHEIPAHGLPLGIWPGVSPAAAEVLKRAGIRSVEEVASLTEGQLDRIQLPGMRDLRKSAKLFLDNLQASESAQRETDRDNEIAALKAQLEETNSKFSAAMELLEQHTNPLNEVSELRAQLDAKGIKYHPKHGVESLRALLTQEAA